MTTQGSGDTAASVVLGDAEDISEDEPLISPPAIPSTTETEAKAPDVGDETSDEAPDQQSELEQIRNQLAESTAANAKLENDLKSQRIGRERQAERDRAQDDMRLELEAMRKTIVSMGTHVGSGDYEALSQEMTTIQGDADRVRTERAFVDASHKAKFSIVETANEVGLDAIEGPEMELVRQIFAQGNSTSDSTYFNQAILEAHKVALETMKIKATSEKEEEVGKVKAEVRRTREAAGMDDLNTGAGGGGSGSVSTESFLRNVGEGKRLSREEWKRVDDALEALGDEPLIGS